LISRTTPFSTSRRAYWREKPWRRAHSAWVISIVREQSHDQMSQKKAIKSTAY
jgi:hypothetical protein